MSETVQHFIDPEAEPAAAIVLKLNHGNRPTLGVILPNMQTVGIVEGVPHVSEWQRGGTYDMEVGFWDFRPAEGEGRPKPRRKTAEQSAAT